MIYDADMAVARYPGFDTSGAGLARVENGVLGIVEASWADRVTPSSITIHGMDGYAHLGTDGMTAHGPVASLHDWSRLAPLSLSAGNGLVPFLDALAGKPADLVNVRDAARTIAVMDAFARSKHDGAWATIAVDPA